MQPEDVKVVLVLASWSSGSTSVAGFLDKCGGYTCPPHVQTIDERTPNAYEPREYQQVLSLCIDEGTLKPTEKSETFGVFFPNWIARQKKKACELGHALIVLKHPLQSMLLPAIFRTEPDARVVVVSRPFAKIEATRERRNWATVYGEAGARIIYGATYGWLHDNSIPYITVPYEKFRNDRHVQSAMLQFIGMEPTPGQRADAENWLK